MGLSGGISGGISGSGNMEKFRNKSEEKERRMKKKVELKLVKKDVKKVKANTKVADTHSEKCDYWLFILFSAFVVNSMKNKRNLNMLFILSKYMNMCKFPNTSIFGPKIEKI